MSEDCQIVWSKVQSRGKNFRVAMFEGVGGFSVCFALERQVILLSIQIIQEASFAGTTPDGCV